MTLKPASKAIADGNPIRALVPFVGMNRDGHTSGGITQPCKDMQTQLILDTYRGVVTTTRAMAWNLPFIRTAVKTDH
ncbi:hypothetical protein F4820DRAFT_432106 [Hypoxylon rubiginosum]|uniref:Uncharacterized protein n=1 Tax=Hypoxylon rubiginosum TaxID=110542 RepID=A0ACB9YR84_9PEZI|nr:hypothetical protein F4820DRAFT_432106 [Hypoxylon rubiginosum]